MIWEDAVAGPCNFCCSNRSFCGKTEKITARTLFKHHTALQDVVVWLLQTIAVVGVATLPLECQVFLAYSCHGDDASAQQ